VTYGGRGGASPQTQQRQADAEYDAQVKEYNAYQASIGQPGMSGIMDFTGVQAAIDYVKAKVGAFFQLPYEFSQAKKKIPALLAVAKQKGDNTAIAKLSAIHLGVNKLQADYPATETKMKSFLDSLKSAGLGIIPLVVAGAAIVVGGAVAYQLVTWGKIKTELNAIEKGLVPPGFFDQKLFGFSIPTSLLLVGGGLAAFVVWKGFKK
jgi:hypothetical protein